jgi:hypothetical protein
MNISQDVSYYKTSLGFSKLFQVTSIVAHGDIFRSVVLMLGVNKLLAMVKDSTSLALIAIGKVFF